MATKWRCRHCSHVWHQSQGALCPKCPRWSCRHCKHIWLKPDGDICPKCPRWSCRHCKHVWLKPDGALCPKCPRWSCRYCKHVWLKPDGALCPKCPRLECHNCKFVWTEADRDICPKCPRWSCHKCKHVWLKADGDQCQQCKKKKNKKKQSKNDLDDEKEDIMSNVTYINSYQQVSSSSSYKLILTYFYGKNKYFFYVEKHAFSNGHFKKAYKATMYKSEVVTDSSARTPKIVDGTSVVLKVKHRIYASDASKDRPILKRSGWNKDLEELQRLGKYCKEWNKHKYSDKTYEVSQAFVLKVSDEGINRTGQFQKGEYVLVEPYMPQFEKWNWPTNVESFAKAYSIQAFGHFTYHYSKGKEVVNDAQGYRDDNKYILTDPYYVDGNDSRCDMWFESHECNKFCKSWWKRPVGVQKRQLRANFAYGKAGKGNSRVRPTGWH